MSDLLDISIDAGTAVRQAHMTAEKYLDAALGYTENLPKGVDRTAIIVALIQASSADFNSAVIARIGGMIQDQLYGLIKTIEGFQE